MRVLLDTNVFVSALLRTGSSRAIVEALRDGAFTLITSEALVAEIAEVIARPKFSAAISADDRRELLALITRDAHFVTPHPVTLHVRDPKDRLVLACAYAADILVSGDHDLQVLRVIGTTEVLSPSRFLAKLSHH